MLRPCPRLGPLLAALLAGAVLGASATPLPDATIRTRVEAIPDREAAQRVALIRPALDAAMHVDDRLWLLERLTKALARQRQWQASVNIAREALALARTPSERARFNALMGRSLLSLKRGSDAFKAYEAMSGELQPLAKSPDAEQQRVAADLRQVGGAALAEVGRLPEAMEVLTQALRAYDALNDGVRQAEALNEIAMVHYLSGHMEEAIATVQRAIEALKAAGGDGPLSHYYLRRGHFESQLGRIEAQEQSLLLGERHARAEGSSYYLAVAATNLADVALQRKNYESALKYANQAIPLVEANDDKESIAVGWINRGIALNRLRREGGIGWIERGYEAMLAIPGHQLDAAMVQDVLAKELTFNGDYRSAYIAARKFQTLADDHRKATDMKRLAEADASYKADLKQRQIEELQREQQVLQRFRALWILIAVLGLGTALVVVLSRRSLRKAYRAMEDMALQDPLTGLKNRRYLSTHIEEDLAQHRRHQHSPNWKAGGEANRDLAFLMIDVDHFKLVNDTHGHAAGDTVLVQMAAILRQATRDSDCVVRWGGEEFLVVARSTSMHAVHLLAERIRSSVEAHRFDIGSGQELRKTCSIGFACYPSLTPSQPWPHWENVVSLADQCLYRVKQSTRNACIGAIPAAGGTLLSWSLDRAVETGEVELVQSLAQHTKVAAGAAVPS